MSTPRMGARLLYEPPGGLKIHSAADLLGMEIKAREYALRPVLPLPGLAMCFSQRGVGKTYLGLTVALALASGGQVTPRWHSPQPRRVLYVDGEMPAGQLQERLARLIKGGSWQLDDSALRFAIADLEDFGFPSLARDEMQAALEPHLADTDVIILDNLSTLATGIRENEADDWTPVQQWLLAQRSKGRSVLMFHHAGKGGEQRGTSRREDVLDTVIELRRPNNYADTEGARFEVHYRKARGITGPDAEPFEAMLTETNDGLTWTVRDLAAVHRAHALELLADDMSVREVAEETGMSKSAVHRLKKHMPNPTDTRRVGETEE